MICSAATPQSRPAQELSDRELVARILSGETYLFEIVMRRANQRIYRAVRSILRDESEVEDVMQQAYVNGFAHLGEFEGRSQLSTWLTRIAVYEAFARKRRDKRFSPLDDEPETNMSNQFSTSATPEQGASDHELGKVLEKAIEALPESFRVVFVLRAVEDMSVAETSEVLDIPEETVKTRLHRARGLLRKSILDRTESTLPTLLGFHLSRCDRIVSAVMRRIQKHFMPM
jgi:RNA polymerase sigma-70 factor (ECF subfamily)